MLPFSFLPSILSSFSLFPHCCFVRPSWSSLSGTKIVPSCALTLNALNLLVQKRKKGGRWEVEGGEGEIAAANTATLILRTQDLCLLQSFAAVSYLEWPRHSGSRFADARSGVCCQDNTHTGRVWYVSKLQRRQTTHSQKK